MNPLIITGILAVTIASSAMMVSFTDEQLQYSNTSEMLSTMQVQRVQEEMLVTIKDDGSFLQLTNTGSVPIRVMDIRVLDDDGHILSTHKTDIYMASFLDTGMIPLDSDGIDLQSVLRNEQGDIQG